MYKDKKDVKNQKRGKILEDLAFLYSLEECWGV